MAKLHHRTRASISGVFLLDQASLEKLDEIVADRLRNFRKLRNQDISKKKRQARDEAEKDYEYIEDREHREEVIEQFVERAAESYPLSRNTIDWILYLRSGEKLNVKGLRDSFTHEAVQDKHIDRFELDIKCGRYDCKLELKDWWGTSIDIDVSPSHLAESSRTFSELERWARENSLPKAFQWWRGARSFFVSAAIWWIAILLITAMIYFGKDDPGIAVQDKAFQLRSDVETILDDGVTTENQDRAIELLLKLSLYGDTLPEESARETVPETFFTPLTMFWIVMVFPLTALCFPPKTVVGAGAGVAKLRRTRFWIRLLTVLLPLFLFMGVLASAAGSFLFSWISQ